MKKISYNDHMKRFLTGLFLLWSASAYGYEFVVSDELVQMITPAPKEVLDARSMPTAVVHVVTDIKGLKNDNNFCMLQEETDDGYYFFVVANEPVTLVLSAPQFRPLEVSFEDRLATNEVRQLKITRDGKDPSEFHFNWNEEESLSFTCEEDPSNLASSFYEARRGSPQVWIHTDLPFEQLKPLFNKDVYELISSEEISPYRLVIKTADVEETFPFEQLFVKKMRKDDTIKFLKDTSDMQKGDSFTPFTTYKLNVFW